MLNKSNLNFLLDLNAVFNLKIFLRKGIENQI